MANFHKFKEEHPESMRLLVVVDNKGKRAGHLNAKIVWDEDRDKFVCTFAHYAMVDLDNIVEWCYLDEI